MRFPEVGAAAAELTLGNVVRNRSRRVTWKFVPTAEGIQDYEFRAWSENGGTRRHAVRFDVQPLPAPDLIVQSVRASDTSVTPGQSVHALGRGPQPGLGAARADADPLLPLERCDDRSERYVDGPRRRAASRGGRHGHHVARRRRARGCRHPLLRCVRRRPPRRARRHEQLLPRLRGDRNGRRRGRVDGPRRPGDALQHDQRPGLDEQRQLEYQRPAEPMGRRDHRRRRSRHRADAPGEQT